MNYKKYLELNEVSGQNMLWRILDQKKLSKQIKSMDEQTKKLLLKSSIELGKALTLSNGQARAFNRLGNLIELTSTNEANLRNQVFKIANELGIKLPSSSF